MARRLLAALFTVAALVFAAAPSTAAPTAQLTRLEIGHSNVAAPYIPLWVADAAGYFRQYGIDANVRNAGSGAITMAALASGDVQVAYTAGPGTVNAILGGSDVRVFGGYLDRMPYQLVTRPDIQSVADLRGQAIAINRFGGASDFVLNYLLAQYGLDATRDVSMLQLGDEAQRVAALRAGAVAATIVNPPFQATAQQAGLRVLFDTATLPVRYSQTVLVAQRAFLDQNQPIAQAVLLATQDGLRRFKQDQEFSTRIMAQHLRLEDPALLTATWEYYRNAYSDDLEPRGLQVILEEAIAAHPERAGTRVEDLVDLRALNDLRAQGRLP